MAKVEITSGGNREATITKDGELNVIQASYPPFVEQKVQPFRQYLTADGTSGGSNDLGVDGSSTNVDFWIPASTSNDRYITTLSFIVGYAATGKPFQWADGAALTNGTRLWYENRRGEHDIHDAIKANQDLFRLSFDPIPTSWEVRHVNANNDYGYFVSTDLRKMGLPFGIKLDAGTTQRLSITIKDNAGTSAVAFNCIGYGFERFE
jgi:hypothetical protein